MHGRGSTLRSRALLLVVVAILGWDATNVHAQTQAPALPPAAKDLPVTYTEAVHLALTEYELGHYAEARAHFLEAHEAFPNARSLRFLGKVEYDLENYAASIDFLERALASELRPLDDTLRSDAQRLLRLARTYVGTYAVRLTPEEAKLEVDGAAVNLRDDKVILQVGEHTLAAYAEGYRPQRKQVEVVGGRDAKVDRQIELHLQPLPERTAHRKRRAWWISGAAGMVLAGVVTALALSLPRTTVADPDGGSTGQTLSPIPN